MTSSSDISRLEFGDVRSAWPHEAINFTPWLYQNLEQLAEVVGMRLEPEGSEVAVETFSADILARNSMDDSRVLIENQLEGSDHTHLGQIMTYLAGLDAQTIIWVATDFRESHLSAIKWLNEHTDDNFAFFAVKVQVVRISGSPFAPLFEVIERPNNWERRLQAATANREEYSEIGQKRFAFWSAYVDRVPGENERSGEAQRTSNRWRVLDDLRFIISMNVAQESVGIFIRGLRGSTGEEERLRLMQHQHALEQRLEVPMGDNAEYFFSCWHKGDFTDSTQWDRLIDWLAERAKMYESALREILGEGC